MSKRYILLFTSVALMILTRSVCAQQKDTSKWTPTAADKWLRSKQWSDGQKVNAHPSINAVEFAKQYEINRASWDKAIAFLNSKKLDTLKPGKYEIEGVQVFATITEAPSKEFAQSSWESHRNYIDLQYVIKGKEKIGVIPVSSATVTSPYDQAKDITNYNAEGKYYVASPGQFFLFFPSDAHRPNIKVDGYDTVKKLVIKIRYIPVP